MTVVAIVVGVVAGLAGGWLVPRLIAVVPEPEPNPDEDPEDFPEKVPYREVAASAGLAVRSAVACAVAGGLLGGAFGWDWPLLWLLFVAPVCCALAIIDWRTWYLPSWLVRPAFAGVLLLVGVASVATTSWHPIVTAVVGAAALGGYYGLLWFISPRIMAFGDVRLGSLLGLALGPIGWGALMLSAVAAGLIGAVALLPMLRAGVMIRRHAPFGPFLVIGALVAALVGGFVA